MYSVVLVLCLVASTNANNSFKLVGGTDTSIEYHPYQVSIEDRSGHICGGALIAPNIALTAAGCLGKNPQDYRVRAGSTFRNKGGMVLIVDSYVFHSNYSNKFKTYDYDIAAVRVIKRFNLGPSIQVIRLVGIGATYFTGFQATLSGWGITQSNYGSEILQALDVRFVGYDTCKRLYTQKQITRRMICFTEEGKGPCKGDEGSPLIGYNKLIGIASFSEGCARPEFPAVFVDIGHQPIWEWIQQFLVRFG